MYIYNVSSACMSQLWLELTNVNGMAKYEAINISYMYILYSQFNHVGLHSKFATLVSLLLEIVLYHQDCNSIRRRFLSGLVIDICNTPVTSFYE